MQETQSKWAYLYPDIDELAQTVTNKTEIARILKLRHHLQEDVDALRQQVRNYLNGKKRDFRQYGTDKITTDKKTENFHWRDWVKPIQKLQKLAQKGSGGARLR